MTPTTPAMIQALVRAARPWVLLGSLLFYVLGGGIARYLGNQIDWPVFWIGLGLVTMLELTSYFLREYFDRAGQPPFETPPPPPPPPPPRRRPPAKNKAEEEEEEPLQVIVPRVIFFQSGAATLTIGAVLTVLLYAQHKLDPPAILFLVLALLLALVYAVPPTRLVYSGYGELVMAFLVANLFPSLAYLLQTGALHRLLAMLTFPLTLLFLAAVLARSLQGFLEDMRRSRQTMLVRLGWERGMFLHNVLIAMAYLVLVISVLVGLPIRLAWPAFLSLPVALFEIWQMNAIANGAKPRWRLLGYTALALVGLTAYFINFALWVG